MHPRFTSPQSLFRHVRRLARRPWRLALGAAAASAVTAAAIAAGVSAGQPPAAGAAGHLAVAAGRAAPHAAPAHRPDPGTPSPAASHNASADHSASADHGASAQHGASAGQQSGSQHGTGSQHGQVAHDRKSHPPARHQAPSRRHTAPARRKPYLIYDSVTPSAIPAGKVAATYATGNYAASPAQVAGHKAVLWIDTTGYDHAASVLDVEPGDATPAMAGSWAWHRLHANPHSLARLYTMQSEWPAVKAAVAKLPAQMRSRVRYWIADPTGTPHIVPGSDATQWYWGSSYDITSATPRF